LQPSHSIAIRNKSFKKVLSAGKQQQQNRNEVYDESRTRINSGSNYYYTVYTFEIPSAF
jgi:hypothetical protein